MCDIFNDETLSSSDFKALVELLNEGRNNLEEYIINLYGEDYKMYYCLFLGVKKE